MRGGVVRIGGGFRRTGSDRLGFSAGRVSGGRKVGGKEAFPSGETIPPLPRTESGPGLKALRIFKAVFDLPRVCARTGIS